jgi:uncharacterized protein YfeS
MNGDFDYGAYCKREKAHPRAVSLMTEDFFWNCIADDTPFGSDEGSQAYSCWRGWRASNPDASLREAMASWILGGDGLAYLSLSSQERPLEGFEGSSYVMDWDLWTLNITIIATALSQLLDEGNVDEEAKPFVFAATAIERSPHIENPGFMPTEVLDAIDRVIKAA